MNCCEPMKESIHDWPKQGLVYVAMMNGKTGEVSNRVGYKIDGKRHGRWFYINFCPWCGTKHNEWLQAERESKGGEG